jgi:hypothetical protein
MSRSRKSVPKKTEKLLYQESNSQCVFCSEDDVSLLEMHHIVPWSEGGTHHLTNLILVCRNCHGRIEDGSILPEKVNRRKIELASGVHHVPERDAGTKKDGRSKNVSFNGTANSSIIANDVSFSGDAKMPSNIRHPQGSIGADVVKKGYIDYLIGRYYDYRKADASYGRQRPFHHAEIHTSIQRKFKAKTFFIPVGRFEELVVYIKKRIDRTIQGKRNRKSGHRNYSSFEDYRQEQGG